MEDANQTYFEPLKNRLCPIANSDQESEIKQSTNLHFQNLNRTEYQRLCFN